MRYTLEYRRRGGQLRPYGPSEYDFTLTIEGLANPSDILFDNFVKQHHVWQHENLGGGPLTFWDWTLVERTRTDNSVRYRLRKAYDD